jgi:4-amino-4-deoxy-L-arabinose transferase-like glycosyltransferase
MKPLRLLLPIVLVLLLAFALRTVGLTTIPPGLTHDEANHGREAIGILQGQLALFFPLNYGSEPLYSYTVAGHMALLGEGLLALRLVNVFFGLGAIAVTYRWARTAFGRRTALLAAALMAVSFWPIASSREALRAGMMPFFAGGAVIFFWQLLYPRQKPVATRTMLLLTLGFAVCVIATLYNYLAARVWWLLFPAFLLYLALTHRDLLRRVWRATLGALALAGLAVIPLALYLRANPQAQTRLQMLDGTLQRILRGDILPVAGNAAEALLAFVWPGYGDQFLAYNIPGRPVFDVVTAIFFGVGVVVALWRWRRPAYAFLLLWFIVGITPSLITGATANTTRNLGALAPTFMLPAVGFLALARTAAGRWPVARRALAPLAVAWLLFAGVRSSVDYFVRWGQSPDVRAAYQQTLVAELDFLAQTQPDGPVVVSSVYPGPAHNPSIALVLAPRQLDLRWVDARAALVLPGADEPYLVAPAATPLHPAFASWVEPVATVQLRPEDLNPSFTLYRLQADEVPHDAAPAVFGQTAPALTLLGSEWRQQGASPGGVAELMLVWRVEDPAAVGPILPGLGVSDVLFFTHVLDQDGEILVQQDRIDAPSWDWRAGDVIVQIHDLPIPQDTAAGQYTVVTGVYDRLSGDRLPLLAGAGLDETRAIVDPLNIIP